MVQVIDVSVEASKKGEARRGVRRRSTVARCLGSDTAHGNARRLLLRSPTPSYTTAQRAGCITATPLRGRGGSFVVIRKVAGGTAFIAHKQVAPSKCKI